MRLSAVLVAALLTGCGTATSAPSADDPGPTPTSSTPTTSWTAPVPDHLRGAIEACREDQGDGGAQVYKLAPGDSGDESFFVTHRYRSDYGFDTGLEVIGVARLGDLVLLSFEYGEGGGSADSIRRSLREVVEQSDALVPELCEYAADPCAVRGPGPA